MLSFGLKTKYQMIVTQIRYAAILNNDSSVTFSL